MNANLIMINIVRNDLQGCYLINLDFLGLEDAQRMKNISDSYPQVGIILVLMLLMILNY